MLWRILISLSLMLLVIGCEPDNQDQKNNAFYHQGYDQGKNDGEKVGYDAGYKSAFSAVHPGAHNTYSDSEKTIREWLTALGALKVLLSISFAVWKLFYRTKNNLEVTGGKLIAVVLGGMIAFISEPFSHVSDYISSFFLISTGFSSWLVIAGAAICSYVVASIIVKFLRSLHGAKIEGLCILLLSATAVVIARSVWAFFASNAVEDYLGSSIMIGILTGGLFYLMLWLLDQKMSSSAANPA